MEIIDRLRKGIDITEDPFGDLAKELGISKEELISKVWKLVEDGFIDGFRVLINHRRLGYVANALVAMRMDSCDCDFFIKNPNISHFYRRTPDIEFPYNYYAMVHFRDNESLNRFLMELDRRNIPYVVMKTVRNLKGE